MTAPNVRALHCPECGGEIVIRAAGLSESVVCSRCSSILDARDPGLRVLSGFREKMRVTPLIPLGTRGVIGGTPWEAVGCQERTITVEGTDYSWREYLLFNPYRGFRWLTEYQGHWNDVVTLPAPPKEVRGQKGRPAVEYEGTRFEHFQSAVAKTTFVIGEFPWRIQVGDVANTGDYVAPPRMLSKEVTPDETTWSLGTYLPGAEVWKAFKLPGRPKYAVGVFADQPSPYEGSTRALMGICVAFLAVLVALLIGTYAFSAKRMVYSEERIWTRPPATDTVGEDAWVTPVFALDGRTSDVELRTETNLDNGWLWFNYALIDEASGRAWDLGREVSYYHGWDDGEAWHEGSSRDRALISAVPPGRYYLRVGVEGPIDAAASASYRVTVRRDVPVGTWFALAFLALIAPPLILGLRHAAFEQARWKESDYAPVASDDDE